MLNIKLLDDRSRGRGWVRVLVQSDISINGASMCSIERLGLSKPVLGPSGWQVASHRLPIEVNQDATGEEFYFHLGPEVVQHMQAGINYQFTIFDLDNHLLAAFPCPWKGVPGYSPPRTGIRVGVAPESMIITTPSAIDLPDLARSSMPSGNDSLWGLISTNHSEDITTDETAIGDQFTDSSISQPIYVSDSIENDTTTKEIYKVACPHCNHTILSNMTFCPICSRPI